MIDRHTEAECQRSMIADHPFVPGGEKSRITLCIGLIEIDGSLDRIELLARADQAMYRAKQNGCNRVMRRSNHSCWEPNKYFLRRSN
jgi:PleD family two-component response regulator